MKLTIVLTRIPYCGPSTAAQLFYTLVWSGYHFRTRVNYISIADEIILLRQSDIALTPSAFAWIARWMNHDATLWRNLSDNGVRLCVGSNAVAMVKLVRLQLAYQATKGDALILLHAALCAGKADDTN